MLHIIAKMLRCKQLRLGIIGVIESGAHMFFFFLSFHRGGFQHQTANKQKESSQAIITFAFRQYLLLF